MFKICNILFSMDIPKDSTVWKDEIETIFLTTETNKEKIDWIHKSVVFLDCEDNVILKR